MDCSHHAVFKTRKTTFRRSITQFSVSDLDPDSVCCGGFRRGGGGGYGASRTFSCASAGPMAAPVRRPGRGASGRGTTPWSRWPTGRGQGSMGIKSHHYCMAGGMVAGLPRLFPFCLWRGHWLEPFHQSSIPIHPTRRESDHPHRPSFRDAMAPSHRSLVKAHPVRGRRRPAVRRVPRLGPPPRLPHLGKPLLPPLEFCPF